MQEEEKEKFGGQQRDDEFETAACERIKKNLRQRKS